MTYQPTRDEIVAAVIARRLDSGGIRKAVDLINNSKGYKAISYELLRWKCDKIDHEIPHDDEVCNQIKELYYLGHRPKDLAKKFSYSIYYVRKILRPTIDLNIKIKSNSHSIYHADSYKIDKPILLVKENTNDFKTTYECSSRR